VYNTASSSTHVDGAAGHRKNNPKEKKEMERRDMTPRTSKAYQELKRGETNGAVWEDPGKIAPD